jgi:hypothetical protein
MDEFNCEVEVIHNKSTQDFIVILRCSTEDDRITHAGHGETRLQALQYAFSNLAVTLDEHYNRREEVE